MKKRVAILLLAAALFLILDPLHFAFQAAAASPIAPFVGNLVYLPLIRQHKPLDVSISPNYSSFVTPWGSLHIVGEVQNNTNALLDSVIVEANLYNTAGDLLDSEAVEVYLENLPPDDKTCFDITFLDTPSGWYTYDFEDPMYTPGNQSPPNLAIPNSSGEYDPNSHDYTIEGQVRNDQSSRVEFVHPVGTLYNTAGRVIGCNYTYVDAVHLNAGQSSGFTLSYYGRDYTDVAAYRLQVGGDSR